MTSREKILAAVKNNQPSFVGLPAMHPPDAEAHPADTFMATLQSIGGVAFVIRDIGEIPAIIRAQYPTAEKIVSICPGVEGNTVPGQANPHALADIDLAIIPAHFGVAENAACWVTEEPMVERVLPFICQHLAIVVGKKNIVSNMHQAYEQIGDAAYGFGTFIAGPSKTADIEQSLVLGAHGPKSMIVFLVDDQA
ncbi:MAG TPA: LUD domain-containing protein [Puia sp.]|nr:LUD domain-containing protein [Puia sp.]